MKVPWTDTLGLPIPEQTCRADAGGKVYGIDRWLVRAFLSAIGEPPLRVVLWDGGAFAPSRTPANVGMEIRERGALWRLLANPLLHFGDDYCTGRIRIEGDVTQFLETVYRSMARTPRFRGKPDPHAYRRNQPRLNSLTGSQSNIHHHYDIGNDFYELWLDREMLYTCAYFPHAGASLEEAQVAKMELVCRKLRLRPGQSVIEAGCGWGALARHMAKHYGVRVRAFNISRKQVEYARERVKAEGLERRVEYIEDDYRNITGKCDVFVSVGMLEHVGLDHYLELGRIMDRCLTEDGFGLVHSIGQNSSTPMNPWFLKRIFPGSYPPTLREMMSLFEPYQFTVLDVENLRLHYAKTCEQWLDRFERNLELVREMYDECFIRAWRLYLAGCVANFNIGALQLFQVLFSRSGNNLVPMTRNHLTTPDGDS